MAEPSEWARQKAAEVGLGLNMRPGDYQVRCIARALDAARAEQRKQDAEIARHFGPDKLVLGTWDETAKLIAKEIEESSHA